MFVFAKCRGKQESPPTFILSNKERKKAQKNSFFEIFLSTGDRFIEREGISTLSIRSYLRALRYLLIILKIVFVFEIFLFYFDLTLASVFKSVTKSF